LNIIVLYCVAYTYTQGLDAKGKQYQKRESIAGKCFYNEVSF
jgi:hypothetical protein